MQWERNCSCNINGREATIFSYNVYSLFSSIACQLTFKLFSNCVNFITLKIFLKSVYTLNKQRRQVHQVYFCIAGLKPRWPCPLVHLSLSTCSVVKTTSFLEFIKTSIISSFEISESWKKTVVWHVHQMYAECSSIYQLLNIKWITSCNLFHIDWTPNDFPKRTGYTYAHTTSLIAEKLFPPSIFSIFFHFL